MAKRKGSSASSPRSRKKATKEGRDAREVEDVQRLLEKLPPEVWEKILDELEENDLFPLALSCRFFRQKQKELVERTRESGPESGEPALALKTNLMRKLNDGQPASVDYLRFCSKEEVPSEGATMRATRIMELAASHGYLPLLQELQKEFGLDAEIFRAACQGGHVEMLKWLRSEGCPWEGKAWYNAANGGHTEALMWLKSMYGTWGEGTCAGAASGGYLEVLRWLRSEGVPL